MEPVGPIQYRFPVKFFCRRLHKRGAAAVINDLTWPLTGALFQKINAHAIPATDNLRRVHAKLPQGIDRRLPNFMGWQLRHKRRVHPVVCQRDGDVRLTASIRRPKHRRLHKTAISNWGKPKHNFTKRNDFLCHVRFPFPNSPDPKSNAPQSRKSPVPDK